MSGKMSEIMEAVNQIWKRRTNVSDPKYWDDDAEYYGEIALPAPQNDDLMALICSVIDFKGDENVIDIGCGSGQYAVALASMAGHCLGVDFSGGMVETAKQRAGQLNNVRFEKLDWHVAETSSDILKNGFDVSIAHTTPAISDADSFRKMVEITRGAGFITFCTRRTDILTDNMWKSFGLRGNLPRNESAVPCSLAILWDKGIDPEIHYQKGVIWDDPAPYSKALFLCRSSALSRGYSDLGAVEEYVRSITDADGNVPNRIETDLTTVYWVVE